MSWISGVCDDDGEEPLVFAAFEDGELLRIPSDLSTLADESFDRVDGDELPRRDTAVQYWPNLKL